MGVRPWWVLVGIGCGMWVVWVWVLVGCSDGFGGGGCCVFCDWWLWVMVERDEQGFCLYFKIVEPGSKYKFLCINSF